MKKKYYYIFAAALIGLFLLITLRLAWLSLVQGDQLALKAEEQYTQEVSYYQYNRGDFYDCLGRKFTGVQSPCLVVFTSMMEDIDQAGDRLASVLDLDKNKIKSRLNSARAQGIASLILKANLQQNEVEQLAKEPLPGAYVLPLAARYQASTPLVHILGFASAGETAADYLGRAGLEKQYDRWLSGHYGPRVAALTDEKGRQLTGSGFVLLSQQEEDRSASIKLTVNIDYQEQAEMALAGQEGAVVILDADNGDILAMASAPKYDPYFWQEPESDDAYVNKCLSLYPPASTFKALLALAALTEKTPLAEDFVCNGQYLLSDGRTVHCWKLTGHGEEDMAHALAGSCNCYFVDLGLRLGGDTIKKYAALLGLDRQEIIGYNAPGGVYIDFHSNVEGDVANASIGEKGIRLSPLLVAQLTAAVANGGKRVYPRLVKEITGSDGQVLKTFPAKAALPVIEEKSADQVKKMFRLAVTEGTAWRADLSGIDCGGKTGTSQEQGIWFTGFAPVDHPRWVVTVYLENGVAGGTEAALVFAQVVKSLVNFTEENN